MRGFNERVSVIDVVVEEEDVWDLPLAFDCALDTFSSATRGTFELHVTCRGKVAMRDR